MRMDISKKMKPYLTIAAVALAIGCTPNASVKEPAIVVKKPLIEIIQETNQHVRTYPDKFIFIQYGNRTITNKDNWAFNRRPESYGVLDEHLSHIFAIDVLESSDFNRNVFYMDILKYEFCSNKPFYTLFVQKMGKEPHEFLQKFIDSEFIDIKQKHGNEECIISDSNHSLRFRDIKVEDFCLVGTGTTPGCREMADKEFETYKNIFEKVIRDMHANMHNAKEQGNSAEQIELHIDCNDGETFKCGYKPNNLEEDIAATF